MKLGQAKACPTQLLERVVAVPLTGNYCSGRDGRRNRRALDGKVARRALSSAGAVVIRSASAKLSQPDVFHVRHRFFPPTKGFAAACFIHEATWCSSRSSTDASSTPRVDLPIPIGVTGGSGLISVPRMNISFT